MLKRFTFFFVNIVEFIRIFNYNQYNNLNEKQEFSPDIIRN